MDLGAPHGHDDTLAFDVDGDVKDVNTDTEALDTDDEVDNEELGIDADESDGMLLHCLIHSRLTPRGSSYAYCSSLCPATEREADASLSTASARSTACRYIH